MQAKAKQATIVGFEPNALGTEAQFHLKVSMPLCDKTKQTQRGFKWNS